MSEELGLRLRAVHNKGVIWNVNCHVPRDVCLEKYYDLPRPHCNASHNQDISTTLRTTNRALQNDPQHTLYDMHAPDQTVSGEHYAACNIIKHDWFCSVPVKLWAGISFKGHTDHVPWLLSGTTIQWPERISSSWMQSHWCHWMALLFPWLKPNWNLQDRCIWHHQVPRHNVRSSLMPWSNWRFVSRHHLQTHQERE